MQNIFEWLVNIDFRIYLLIVVPAIMGYLGIRCHERYRTKRNQDNNECDIKKTKMYLNYLNNISSTPQNITKLQLQIMDIAAEQFKNTIKNRNAEDNNMNIDNNVIDTLKQIVSAEQAINEFASNSLNK